MDLAVVIKCILRCAAPVTEAVAQIESEGDPVDQSWTGTPVPAVVIGPDSASPVKDCHIFGRIKIQSFISQRYAAFYRHTIDLLIIIECFFILSPRGGNAHALCLRLQHLQICFQSLPIEEIREDTADPSVPRLGIETDVDFSIVKVHCPRGRYCPQSHPPHRERCDDRLCVFPRANHLVLRQTQELAASLQIDQRYTDHTGIAQVWDRKSNGEILFHHQIIVPFLYTQGHLADIAPVIDPDRVAGPAGLRHNTGTIQKTLSHSHFMLHPRSPPKKGMPVPGHPPNACLYWFILFLQLFFTR